MHLNVYSRHELLAGPRFGTVMAKKNDYFRIYPSEIVIF